MIKQITHINVGGVEYPLAFNLNVLETIQEEYGNIDKWAELTGGAGNEPRMKDLKFGFREMINEGIDMENEEKSENRAFVTDKQVGRILSVLGSDASLSLLHSVTVDSVGVDTESNEKNA